MPTTYTDPVMLDSTGQDIVTKLDTIAGLMGDGVINDSSTAADKTWSASKINTQLGTKANANLVPSGASTSNKLATASDVDAKVSWRDANKFVQKNLLNNVAVTSSQNNINWTVNADKSVTINTTAAASADTFKGLNASMTLPAGGKYKVNGITGGSLTTFFFQIYDLTSNTSLCNATDGDTEFTYTAGHAIKPQLVVKSGQTVSNKTIYPMIRYADITDSSYVPYILDNTELVDWKNAEKSIKKNLAKAYDYLVGGDDTQGYMIQVTDAKNRCIIAEIEDGVSYKITKANMGNRFKVIGLNELPNSSTRIAGTEIYSSDSAVSYDFTNTANYKYIAVNLNLGATLSGDIQGMIRLASIADDTYAPYIPDNTELVDWKNAEKSVQKNILKNSATSKTENNVTFTVNSDGTVSVSTTDAGASSDTILVLATNTFLRNTLEVGVNYILSGCPSGGADNKYFVSFTNNVDGSRKDTGSGITFTDYNRTTYTNVSVVIMIKSGQIITTPILFKPMIRLATIVDDVYAPYIFNNAELTENKVDKLVKELTSSDDLDYVFETGLYGIGSSSPTNAPENVTLGTLIVQKSSSNSIRQMIIKGSDSGGLIYIRNCWAATPSWTKWTKFSGTLLN